MKQQPKTFRLHLRYQQHAKRNALRSAVAMRPADSASRASREPARAK